MNPRSYLVQNDGHEEVIDEEGFWIRPEVVLEEEECENDVEELMRRIYEGTTEHLQTAHDYDEGSNAGQTIIIGSIETKSS